MKKQAKKMVAGILAAVSLFGAFAFTGCKETTDKNEAANNTPSASVPVAPVKPSYDGTIVQAGGNYNFSNKIAFLSSDIMTTSEGEYTPVSATLTATVEPADANQAVDWRVSFVNAESDWASGKTVTDYVTITTETAGSTTATVTCSAPFGEQVKIECISQDNPNIKAECRVDLLQGVENVSLTFGDDLPINLGGKTDVVWEINPSGIGKGGAANVVIDKTDTYTVAINYNWMIDLHCPRIYYENGADLQDWGEYELKSELGADASINDGYFVLANQVGIERTVDCGLRRLDNIKELTFNNAFFSTCMAGYIGNSTTYLFKELSTSAIIANQYFDGGLFTATMGFGSIKEGSLYTLKLKVYGSYGSGINLRLKGYDYSSLLNLTGYTNDSNVQSVTLDNTQINF